MARDYPSSDRTSTLAALDHAHIWHPFTPMRQWCSEPPLIIERAEGCHLIDTDGQRYIDGVSSLWCNVHGHRVPRIDQAIRDQLDQVAHTTLLGLASPPSIELAARLVALARNLNPTSQISDLKSLNKVFYSDAGATALEVAFKMAVGYWFHNGKPEKRKFIGLCGAYHGDTVGSMSIGYSDLFHKPFSSMVFEVKWSPAEVGRMKQLLNAHAQEMAAVVIEPVMQGAAGMVCQPPGFVKAVRELCDEHDVLLIADEVAVGFGRTGTMFACEHDQICPDILCLAKGLTGGYLPVAATLCTDEVYNAFCGELDEKKTLYHGHTYTGNALGCAAALASLELFDDTSVYPNGLLAHINASAAIMKNKLNELRDHPHIVDIRQRGMMVGIELCQDRNSREPFDFSKRTGAALCQQMRERGLIVRPLGDVIILMPIPAMPHELLGKMMDIVAQTLHNWTADDMAG